MKSICNKLIVFLFMFLTLPCSFAINNEPSTNQAAWIVTDNGLPYSIERDGNYHDTATANNQYYRFGSGQFGLILQVQDAPPGTPAVVFTNEQSRNLISTAIERIINPTMNVDFSIAPNPQVRAITIDIENLPMDAVPSYAETVPPHASQRIMDMNDPIQAMLYNRYNQNGGIALFVNMIQTSMLSWNNYQYALNNHIIAPGTTLQQYAAMQLTYTIAHEFTHILGAIHATAPNPDWLIALGYPAHANPMDIAYNMDYATLAGSGEVNYLVPVGQPATWRPSLIAPTFRLTPQNTAPRTADNYFIALSNYLNRPITVADIQPALQDSNIMLCFHNFNQVQHGGLPLNGPNVFCPVNTAYNGEIIGAPIFTHVENNVASLLQVEIVNQDGIFMDVISSFHL